MSVRLTAEESEAQTWPETCPGSHGGLKQSPERELAPYPRLPSSACSAQFGGQGWAGLASSLGVSEEEPPPTPAGPLSHLSLQRHHFAQAIAILNPHGCNIFDHFSRKVMGLGVGGREWELGAGLRWETRWSRGVEVPEV